MRESRILDCWMLLALAGLSMVKHLYWSVVLLGGVFFVVLTHEICHTINNIGRNQSQKLNHD